MKKILLILSLIILSSSLVFASDFFHNLHDASYRPLSLRHAAMGESGIALSRDEDSLFVNAGAVKTKGFRLVIPSISVDLLNVAHIKDVDYPKIMKGNVAAISEAVSFLSGEAPIARVSLGTAMQINGFVLGVNGTAGLFSRGESISAIFTGYADTALSLGYSHRFQLSDAMTLTLGGTGHVNLRFSTTAVDVNTFVDYTMDNSRKLIGGIVNGYALSLDLGSTLELPYGFSAAVTVNDISSPYIYSDGSSINIPCNVTLGLGWQMKVLGFINLQAAADITDAAGLVRNLSRSDLLYHLNLGAGAGLWNIVTVYGGLRGGYPSFGAVVKLLFAELSAAYTVREYSQYMGYNPKDMLTVSLRLVF